MKHSATRSEPFHICQAACSWKDNLFCLKYLPRKHTLLDNTEFERNKSGEKVAANRK